MASNTYTYKRYMRDGSVQERTGVIRRKTKEKKNASSKERTDKESK